MNSSKTVPPVSVHGGHSGQFCCHAEDTLQQIVAEYHRQGFGWVGLTEHAPPARDELCYPEEIGAGLNAAAMLERFAGYITEARRLQAHYRERMIILVGMEIETCTGCLEFASALRRRFTPDYIVGSVHHVDDIGIDYSRTWYDRAVEKSGGISKLYCRYFDLQYEMLQRLRPEVVGHFDLIRIFDPEYRLRLAEPAISARIMRNLEKIAELDLILDLNLRALFKGANEPYPCRTILEQASRLGIRVMPGDDSHSVNSVGCHMREGLRLLNELGLPRGWPPLKGINP